jgi:phosphinothricin acetyltransferase
VHVKIRPAVPDDAAAIAAIYETGIRSGSATVVSRPPTPDAMRARMASARGEHAWLVAEGVGEVVGWAATMPYLSLEE